MVGQTTVPLVGIVDVVVIGRTGDAAALAGVALGATVVNFLFWSFGFLRMGMTGMTAQAKGAGDEAEMRAMLARGLVAGLMIGTVLFALQWLLIPAALRLFAGGGALDSATRGYVSARFLGAPASLAVFAINGWLLGLGRTRPALLLQIVMSCVNGALDIAFVWGMGMGAHGVGLGTACAEWVALATGLAIALRILGPQAVGRMRAERGRIADAAAMRRLFAVNADIMIRTVALLALFAWFANAGARLGAVQLAANHVLMQFVSVAAFVLDGFAFTAEARVGQAIGARSRTQLVRAIRLTGEFSLVSGMGFAAAIVLAGGVLVDAMADNAAIHATARTLIPYVALVPLLGVPAWLLDGIFIGATAGKALRNAAVLATMLYIGTDLALRPLGPGGVWIALLASYVYRAAALGVALPGLLSALPRTPLAQGARDS